jgi:hypothetical protein
MASAPRRMQLRSTRLEIREQNRRLNEAAAKDYAEKSDFQSRYDQMSAIAGEGCEYCGGNHRG